MRGPATGRVAPFGSGAGLETAGEIASSFAELRLDGSEPKPGKPVTGTWEEFAINVKGTADIDAASRFSRCLCP